MDINLKVEFQKVETLEEASHILALKEYGTIQKGDIVEIYNYCGMMYVYDFNASEENEIFEELDDNFLYKMNCSIK